MAVHLVSALREGRKSANICSSSGVIRGIPAKGTSKMKLRLISAAFAISLLPVTANAQVTIDMSALTCGQYLAMSPSMSRDFSAWVSGWYSYETRRTFVDVLLHQKNIANLKSWCQFNPQTSVMIALQRSMAAVTFWTPEKSYGWVLFHKTHALALRNQV